MTGTALTRPALRTLTLERAGPIFVSAVALLLVSALAALVLASYPPPLAIALVGGLGMSLVLALAIGRYDAAVALGLLLLGVVQVEPAPPDAVFAIVIAVAIVTGRFRLDGAPLSIVAIVVAFLALNVLSIANAVDPARGIAFFAITLYLAVFGIWFAGYVNSERRARLTVRAYLVAAVTSAILGSASLFLTFPGSEIMNNDGLRAKALFADPNVFGPFLVPIALILLAEMLQPRLLRSGTSMKLLLLFVLVLGIFFSYSRGAYVNLLIGIIVMLAVTAVQRGGGRRTTALIAILCFGGIAVFGAASATGSLDFFEQRAQQQSYDTKRFAAQERGIAYGRENLLGIGPGQFEVLAPVPSHNLYVRAFSEQGLLGLVLALAFVLGTLLIALANAFAGRDTFGIASAALLGAWVGMIVESAVIDTLHWRHLWLVAALIWAGASVKKAYAERKSNPPA
jgi:O-antigen ligase